MTKQIQLHVEGMSCGNCVKSIETNIGAIAGVDTVSVSLENKTVDVAFYEAHVAQAIIANTIEDLGFDVK